MATIRTNLQLTDNITSVIRNVSSALGASINAFENLSRASNDAVSTASIEAARRSLGNLNQDLANIESNLQDATNGQNGLNNSINNGSISMRSLVSAALGLVSAYVSLQGLKDALNLADTLASNRARIDLINDGLQTTDELQRAIFESSQRSLSSYQDQLKLVGGLASRARDAFASNAETVQFAENLGKLFSIAGAGQQEQASASLQLTQALGSGVLRGEELNAVLEAAPNIVQKITDYLGVSFGEVRNLAKEGQISADVVKNALLSATDDINSEFAKLPTTFGDAFTVFRNNALIVFQDVLGKLTEISNSQGFQGFLSGLAQSLSVLATVAGHTIDVLASVGNFVAERWNILGPIFFTVAGALTFLGGAFLAVQTYTLLAATATAIFNSALLASPITLVVLSIIALVGVLYLAVEAFNFFAGTSISATGIVAAVFAGLAAYINNIISFFYNLFAGIAEFFYNVWTNPVAAVLNLFGNIANSGISLAESLIGSFDSAATNLGNLFVGAANVAIGAINSIIGALNAIPGVEIGTIGTVSARKSASADLSGLKNKVNNFVSARTPSNYKSFNQRAYTDVPDAIAKGYNSGKNFSIGGGKTSSLVSNGYDNILSSLGGGLGDVGKKLNDINKNAGDSAKSGKDTAKNTKNAVDKAGIASDDLKYIRELSEREAINRYTTASIQLDVKNDLQVNSEIDIDGLIDRFGEKLEESVETVAAGGVVFNV